jgi:hypothetical protein
MPRLVHGLLLLLCAATCNLASARKGDELALFKRYYPAALSTADRKEAVLTLEHVLDPGVFAVLYPKLGEKGLEPDVADAIVRVCAGFETAAQQKQVFDTLQSERGEAGKLALLQVLAQARWKDSKGVVPVLLADKSWMVRRRALEALLAGGDPGIVDKVATLCDDPSDAVRFEALDALSAFQSPLVVPRAIAALDHPSRLVRQSAIHALAIVRDKSAVEPLIRRLNKETGLLTLDLAEALAGLTSREFGPEPERWNKWWAEQDKEHYDIPTLEGVAYLRGRRATKTGGSGWEFPNTKPGGTVFPVETPSRQILYVIDCSGSMETLVTERERFEGQKYPDYSRMEIVKTELLREIERLPSTVRFNIIAFATDVNPWKPSLQQASITVKYAAKEWVKGLHALGGASKEGLALVGLPGASSIEKGRTNAFDALELALGVDDLRTADAQYEKVEADTVFFLSDGRPTAGLYVDPDDILREIRKLNALRKVVIHTIGIGEFDSNFMKRLAEQNGPGQFVDLGK